MSSRRVFLQKVLGISAFALPMFAQAQSQNAAQPSDKKPWRSVNVSEDSKRVVLFFDFACPYCAKYHKTMFDWAATVPPQVQTLFVPVVNMADKGRRSEQVIAAKCYYAAFNLASRGQMATFLQSVYEQKGSGASLSSKNTWFKALEAARINRKSWGAELIKPSLDNAVKYAALKTAQYNLYATPSVAVGGKYVMTPDDVAGEEAMFYNILNGLTSEII